MHEIIFYGSFAVIPFLLFFIFFKKIHIWLRILFIFLNLLFIWMRFVEPQIIIIKNEKIDLGFESKIILISDLHLGKYKTEKFLSKAVEKINNIQADYVFIAGDFTYQPELIDLEKLFAPIWKINKPVYWVLWNHDVEKPGPKLRDELKTVLDNLWANYLNNTTVKLGNFTLVELGSNWNREDDTSLLEEFTPSDNIVVLAYNPDTTLKYSNNIPDLTLAGHTHGGQLRIPGLYKSVIPTTWNFDKWFSQEEFTKLYVSSGIWETAIPMRFLNFPEIVVLELY